MNKHFRRTISLVLALIMCASLSMPAFAANSLGVTFSAVANNAVLQFGTSEQTVSVTVTANQGISLDGFGARIYCPEGWTVASVASEDLAYTAGDLFLEYKTIAFTSATLKNLTGIDQLAVITYNIPAEAATGTYTLGLYEMELTADGAKIWEPDGTASTTVTIVDGDAGAYTAGISSNDTAVDVGEKLTVNVTVGGMDYDNFASSELVLTYDSGKLSFDESSVPAGATVVASDGTLKLEDYGEVKNFGTVYTLVFDATAAGTAEITLTSAKFSTQTHAETDNLVTATITSDTVTATITQTYGITLPDGFSGATSVNAGDDYTFEATDKANYTYEVTATMDGQPVNVKDNGDGTYTIEDVSGELVISAVATPKSYTVTFAGAGAEDVSNKVTTATYKTNYAFTIPADNDSYTYALTSIKYAGGADVPYTAENGTVTILGTDITDAFTITIAREKVLPTTASVAIDGAASDVTAEPTATPGTDYTFTVNMDGNYDYVVTAKVNDTDIELTPGENGAFTIDGDDFKAGDSITITVTKTIKTSNVTVSKYVTVDESEIWLITVNTAKLDNSVYTYKNQNMFWSEKYNNGAGAYCFLVISATQPVITAEDLAIITGSATDVDYGMDVNKTGKVDANDAQLTYNIYNAHYDAFTDDVTVEKLLRADVNGDTVVNVTDAQAVINSILNIAS